VRKEEGLGWSFLTKTEGFLTIYLTLIFLTALFIFACFLGLCGLEEEPRERKEGKSDPRRVGHVLSTERNPPISRLYLKELLGGQVSIAL